MTDAEKIAHKHKMLRYGQIIAIMLQRVGQFEHFQELKKNKRRKKKK